METYYDGNLIHKTSFEELDEGYAEWLEDKRFDSDDGSDFDEDPDSEDEME